jgi:hypothetical protein
MNGASQPKTPTANNTRSQGDRKLSCSVCWQEFSHSHELDDHIRQGHPDRIIDQDELFARAS